MGGYGFGGMEWVWKMNGFGKDFFFGVRNIESGYPWNGSWNQ